MLLLTIYDLRFTTTKRFFFDFRFVNVPPYGVLYLSWWLLRASRFIWLVRDLRGITSRVVLCAWREVFVRVRVLEGNVLHISLEVIESGVQTQFWAQRILFPTAPVRSTHLPVSGFRTLSGGQLPPLLLPPPPPPLLLPPPPPTLLLPPPPPTTAGIFLLPI